MRLSMAILADWLKPYQPELNIKSGNRNILNVRMIADNIRFSGSTVYLNQVGKHTILCSNGDDYMTLHADDVEDVLNDILDALAYYNDYMDQIHRQIMEKCSLDVVLAAGEKLLGKYMVLADPTFYIYKTYGTAETLALYPKYKSALEAHMLPLSVLLDINKEKTIRIPNMPTYEVGVPSMGINTLVTNLFSIATHRGWLITHSESGVYTQCEKDLQDGFCEILQEWMAFNEQELMRRNREEIFYNLIDGKESGEKTEERLAVFHWFPGDSKQIYVIGSETEQSDFGFALIRSLENLDPTGFTFFYGNHLIYVCNHTLILDKHHEEQLERILQTCHSRAGKSAVFYDLNQIRSYYEAAVISLQRALQTNAVIVDMQEIFLDYMCSLARSKAVIPLKHPGLEALKTYDAEHETQLYDTLYIYLKNEQNYATTSQELHVHRNTLLYRIDRIREIAQVELDDYDARLQLEIVYALEKR